MLGSVADRPVDRRVRCFCCFNDGLEKKLPSLFYSACRSVYYRRAGTSVMNLDEAFVI